MLKRLSIQAYHYFYLLIIFCTASTVLIGGEKNGVLRRGPGRTNDARYFFVRQHQHDRQHHSVVRPHRDALSFDVPMVCIDSSFGTNGSTIAFMSGGGNYEDVAYALAFQTDGKIVAGGYSNNNILYNDCAFAIARFDSVGTPDAGFGTAGTVRILINGGDGSLDEVHGIAVQPDGKIVAAGFSRDASSNIAVALVRLQSNGTLDPTFGTNGKVRTFLSVGDKSDDRAYAVALRPDGKIVTAGYSCNSGHYAFAVARFKSNGTPDSTFGTNGSARTYINGGDTWADQANAMVLRADGKITVAGSSTDTSYNAAFALARFSANGRVDSLFGTNGSLRISINGGDRTTDCATALAIQADGKIVAGGYSYNAGHYAFAMARLDSVGTPDAAFGANGTVRAIIRAGNATNDESEGIAIEPDGKIVAAGYSFDDANYTAFALARFFPNGTLQTTQRSCISGGNNTRDLAKAVAIRPNGKIVAVGFSADSNGSYGFALARFTPRALGTIALPLLSGSSNTATFNGAVNAGGRNTTVRFLYGTTSGIYTDSVTAVPGSVNADTGVSISKTVSGLKASTTYYHCVAASNTAGYFRSNEICFATNDFGAGSALSFNGSTSYALHTPLTIAETDNVTIEAWVKWNGSTGVNEDILYNGTPSNDGYGIYLTQSGHMGILAGGNIFDTTAAMLSPGAWTHIAIVGISGQWKLYRNGTALTLLAGNSIYPAVPSDHFTMGGNISEEYFNGSIDEVRISDTARYGADFTPALAPFSPDPHTLALYHLDEGTGSTAIDASGNGNHLTLHGTNWFISDSPVPITLTTLTGAMVEGNVQLAWTTMSEQNNYGFYVQRRFESAREFTTISPLLPGAGTSLEEHQYSWTDEHATLGTCYYRLKQVDETGAETFSSEIKINLVLGVKDGPTPLVYSMGQNYPNPFNPVTTVHYELPVESRVRMVLYNLLGQEAAVVVNGVQQPGYQSVVIDGTALSSGVYLCKLDAVAAVSSMAPFSKIIRIVLMK